MCNQNLKLPRQYKDFVSLNSTTDYQFEHSTMQGNIMYDIWLMPTSTWDWNSDKMELMIWFWRNVQGPAGSYNKTVTFDVYINGTKYSRDFDVYVSGNNTVTYLLSGNYITSGEVTIDLADFFNDALPLVNRGNMWVHSIEFGTEFMAKINHILLHYMIGNWMVKSKQARRYNLTE